MLRPGGPFVFLTPNRRHPLLALNRWLRWTRGRAVQWLYGRAEADTFPAFYRANTIPRLMALLRAVGLEVTALIPIGDPTYLAFHEVLYRLSVWIEGWIPPSGRIHLVGEARKAFSEAPTGLRFMSPDVSVRVIGAGRNKRNGYQYADGIRPSRPVAGTLR